MRQRATRKTEVGDAFPEVKHLTDNSVESLDNAHIHKSIIYILQLVVNFAGSSQNQVTAKN